MYATDPEPTRRYGWACAHCRTAIAVEQLVGVSACKGCLSRLHRVVWEELKLAAHRERVAEARDVRSRDHAS